MNGSVKHLDYKIKGGWHILQHSRQDFFFWVIIFKFSAVGPVKALYVNPSGHPFPLAFSGFFLLQLNSRAFLL